MYCAVHAQRTGTQSMASRLRKVIPTELVKIHDQPSAFDRN